MHCTLLDKSNDQINESEMDILSKTRERLKERFLVRRNRTKRANFRGSPLFKQRTKQQQKNKQLIQLTSCPLDVGGWRKERGTRLTDVI